MWIIALMLLGGAAVFPAVAQVIEPPTVVIVLRHAETEPDGTRDPALSVAGRQRAETLVEATRGAGVTAIYTSQLQRTRETAAPLADALGVEAMIVPIAGPTLKTYPERMAKMIDARHRGETVVVVNHSNTVPSIVEALGGGPAPPIDEDDYANLYVVIIPAEGPVRTIRSRYAPAN